MGGGVVVVLYGYIVSRVWMISDSDGAWVVGGWMIVDKEREQRRRGRLASQVKFTWGWLVGRGEERRKSISGWV
jgi:hypothetical protein